MAGPGYNACMTLHAPTQTPRLKLPKISLNLKALQHRAQETVPFRDQTPRRKALFISVWAVQAVLAVSLTTQMFVCH